MMEKHRDIAFDVHQLTDEVANLGCLTGAAQK